MVADRTKLLAAIYDQRSLRYDNSYHSTLAADFMKWANPQPGNAVLDLACGTGLVSLLAKQAVGVHGKVIGVDASEGMMDVGRQKAIREGLDVTFVNHDISNLSHLPVLSESHLAFDVITCCSALVLLRDPQGALRHWSSFLAPGGKIIFDVVGEKAFLGGVILEKITSDTGFSSILLYNRSWVRSENSVRSLIIDAGLCVSGVFETDRYGSREYDVGDAPRLFEEALGFTSDGGIYDAEAKEMLKCRFVDEFGKLADSNGKVVEEHRLYIGVAEKAS